MNHVLVVTQQPITGAVAPQVINPLLRLTKFAADSLNPSLAILQSCPQSLRTKNQNPRPVQVNLRFLPKLIVIFMYQ